MVVLFTLWLSIVIKDEWGFWILSSIRAKWETRPAGALQDPNPARHQEE